MSDLKRYYDEEMRYLLGAGREFAREHPDAAHTLSIAEVEDRDPFVERLFENFAFLSARVRQTLDSQDESMAGQLLDQAAPGMESPLAATSMVEFKPRPDTSESGRQVERGSEVRTPHLSGLRAPCRFRTIRDCTLHLLRLENLGANTGHDGQTGLEFELVALDSSGLVRWPSELDLFLSGDATVAWALRHWLLRKVRRIDVDASIGTDARNLSFSPAGNEGGYSLEDSPSSKPLLDLRDFLCADDRFRFVSLRGLDEILAPETKSVRIRIVFDQPPPVALERGIQPDTIRLNTVPVVNAFSESCQPHLLDPSRTEYPLLSADGGEQEILETELFQGASQSDPSKSHTYVRFSSWRNSSRRLPETGWYQIHRRPNRSGGMKTSISVGHPDDAFTFDDEYLGGKIWCCDGDIPSEVVRPTDLSEPSTGIPSGLTISGLSRPTQVYRAPATSDYRWKLLSHYQRSFSDLCKARSLQETLRQLLWDPRELKKSVIEKISGLSVATGYELVSALPRPVTIATLTISDDAIGSDAWNLVGQLDEFARLVYRLLAARQPQGTRLVLRLRLLPLGLELEHLS